jgi:uncharacterized protein YigE (DUF2233 family)
MLVTRPRSRRPGSGRRSGVVACGLLGLLALGLGCAAPQLRPTATPTPEPTPTATAVPPPSPTPTWPPSPTPLPPDSGWLLARAGVEYRSLRVDIGQVIERLTIVRVDRSVVRFAVRYDPLTPRPVSAWAEHLGQPIMVINAGYFAPENETLGLLISDGQRWGSPYGDFAGMFAVGPDGAVSLRWLRERPYDPAEALQYALQSFPVLVKPGGVMGFPADADDGSPSRRSVVAQDRQGRVLFMVAPNGYFSLHSLATFLAASDLELDTAMNLDGGTSTGLWLGLQPEALAIESLVPVPSVIVVDPL